MTKIISRIVAFIGYVLYWLTHPRPAAKVPVEMPYRKIASYPIKKFGASFATVVPDNVGMFYGPPDSSYYNVERAVTDLYRSATDKGILLGPWKKSEWVDMVSARPTRRLEVWALGCENVAPTHVEQALQTMEEMAETGRYQDCIKFYEMDTESPYAEV